MAVALTFCGGARTVTGSTHLISTDQSNIILDCGLFYGKRDEYYNINSTFAFNPHDIDACVLGHAHIDHCGNIPSLIKKGFRGSVYCTPATRDLCKHMIPDSGYIQEEDIKYVNKINKRRGRPPREPLYTKSEAEKALKYFRTLEFHKPLDITKDITVTFFRSGHILGSAIPVLEITSGKRQRKMRIAYAVDLGRENMPLLHNPEIPKDIDYLIIESTYGDRRHEDIHEAENMLAESINKTVARGGKIIIPSFALERTQLLVYFISELIKRGKIKKLPIYVDGPLAVNLTEVFRNNWMYFDDRTQEAFKSHDGDPLGYDNITYIKNVNDSKRLNNLTEPSIIISASGMCENGRILHHLKNNIENPKNTILVVGYMAQDTLGRRIMERRETVRIFGRPYDMKAEVVEIRAFSAHADKEALVKYALGFGNKLKEIFIVHGDLKQSDVLRDNIRSRSKFKPKVPQKDTTVYLKAD